MCYKDRDIKKANIKKVLAEMGIEPTTFGSPVQHSTPRPLWQKQKVLQYMSYRLSENGRYIFCATCKELFLPVS